MTRKQKYRNRKVECLGKKFDSILEKNRYLFLLDKQKQGKINSLETQVRFKIEVNCQKICAYVADFTYKICDKLIVEDTKGFITDIFRIKSKLIKAVYGIEIRIVKKPTEEIG